MARKTLADYVITPEEKKAQEAEKKAQEKAKRQKAEANKKAVLNKPNELQKTIDQFADAINNSLFEDKNKIKLMRQLGVGVSEDGPGKFFTCCKCGRLLPRSQFYMSSEVGVDSGIAPICKECATDIAVPTKNGQKQEPTKESVRKALEFLRKPFLDSVWDSSVAESQREDTTRPKNSVWAAYIKNIQMPNYYGWTYDTSDDYSGPTELNVDRTGGSRDSEIMESFEQNKSDTLRLLGYLPFEKEKPEDQPFLYAQLMGFLDSSEDQNDDMMRTSSIISIVRGFLQQSQIDDMIAQLVQDSRHAQQNVATIKSLQAMKTDITRTITQLAKESCISLKNTRNAKKGENTWTGKLKKIKDINLREGEVNGFDLNTCKGMEQVMELSDASIMKQLRLDDSEWSDMVADQREMIRDMQQKLDFYTEASRIILRENLDLRDTLTENGINIENRLIDLEELYAPFIANEVESTPAIDMEFEEDYEEELDDYQDSEAEEKLEQDIEIDNEEIVIEEDLSEEGELDG